MYLVKPPFIYKKIYPLATWKMKANEKKLYLTFDDGPIEELTPWVLDVLKQKEVQATFFSVGETIENSKSIYECIIQEGHKIGNHTYNHLNGWNTHTSTYIKNVLLCDKLMEKADGTKALFRPPYGKIKKSQYKILNRRYKVIMWDVLSGDFDKKTSKEKCLSNVLDNVRKGSIIVFHDNIKAEENLRYVLPLFIDWAIKEGYSFELIN